MLDLGDGFLCHFLDNLGSQTMILGSDKVEGESEGKIYRRGADQLDGPTGLLLPYHRSDVFNLLETRKSVSTPLPIPCVPFTTPLGAGCRDHFKSYCSRAITICSIF